MDYFKNVKKQLKIKENAPIGVRGKGKRPWRKSKPPPPLPEKYRWAEILPKKDNVPVKRARDENENLSEKKQEEPEEYNPRDYVPTRYGPPLGFQKARALHKYKLEMQRLKEEPTEQEKKLIIMNSNISVFGDAKLGKILELYHRLQSDRLLAVKDKRTPLQKAKDMEPATTPKLLFAGMQVRELKRIAYNGEQIHPFSSSKNYTRKRILPTHQAQGELPGWRAPVFAAAWGNGSFYQLGNGTVGNKTAPYQLAHSHRLKFIGVAAGKTHTLLLTDQGLVFSCGKGYHLQLGLGEFVKHQRFLKQVFPTGHLKKNGCDYSIIQVAAGTTASYSREASSSENVLSCKGLMWMSKQLEGLLQRFAGIRSMVEFKCHVEAEINTLHRRGKGRVMSWGTGNQGQLGLGKWLLSSSHPRVIPALQNKHIEFISAGEDHVLALSHKGEVYSWGCGKYGRLGHNDFADRWEPTIIEFFQGKFVTVIAAGTAHSFAAIRSAKTAKSFFCWGRGAHGRLGNGRNLNHRLPVRPRGWPASLNTHEIKAAALGSAHTLVLLVSREPQSSRGYESEVWAWGYGRNGQLGGAKLEDSFFPQKVKLPSWEFVVRIAAGKSHSLALTLQGRLYAWGKNWNGELGLGDKTARCIPTLVETDPSFFVDVAAGTLYSAALAIRKLYIDDKDRRPWVNWNALDWDSVPYLGLEQFQTSLLKCWRCPRRLRTKDVNKEPIYVCSSCHNMFVCRLCSLKCHDGPNHKVKRLKKGRLGMLCECGFSETCKLLPAVQEPPTEDETAKAVRLQASVRCLAAINQRNKMRQEKIETHHNACVSAWKENVINSIINLIQKQQIMRMEKFETDGLQISEIESEQARYYLKLQLGLFAMQQQRRVLRELFFKAGSLQLFMDYPKGIYRGIKMRVWTRTAVRRVQRSLDWRLRWSARKMFLRTKNMIPYGKYVTGTTADNDICQLIELLYKHRDLYEFVDGRKQRRNSIAGPEMLYQRTCTARYSQQIRLQSRRRISFSDEAFVDKHHTQADENARRKLEEYRPSIARSHNLTEKGKLLNSWVRYLSNEVKLQSKKGFKFYNKFQKIVHESHRDADLQTWYSRKHRSSSLCAPERYALSIKHWDGYTKSVDKIYAAARALNYPQRNALVFWRHPLDYSNDESQPSKQEFLQDSATIVQRSIDYKVPLEPPPETNRPKTAKVFGFTMAALKAQQEQGLGNAAIGDLLKQGTQQSDGWLLQPSQQFEEWQTAYDDAGNLYYYNSRTGESSWEPPQKNK